jgi:uncharacterized protein DUF3179
VIEAQRHVFLVSGLLYRRNLLLYDRETESLWSQLLSEAVTGSLAGKSLKSLPVENTTWAAWRSAHPDAQVLSSATGYKKDYRLDPYASYFFPRSPALLVMVGRTTKIYPFPELKELSGTLTDRVGDQELRILYDRKSRTAQIENQPQGLRAVVGFMNDLRPSILRQRFIWGRVARPGLASVEEVREWRGSNTT